jgi:hypothetical protein
MISLSRPDVAASTACQAALSRFGRRGPITPTNTGCELGANIIQLRPLMVSGGSLGLTTPRHLFSQACRGISFPNPTRIDLVFCLTTRVLL